MYEKNWREWFFIIAMCVHIITTIILLIAMLFYTGGTSTNPGAPGYSLWGNSIGDLGRTKAYSGNSNTVSFVLYSIRQITLGILFIPAVLVLPYYFNDTNDEKWLSYIGAFCLSFLAIIIIILAFRPSDLYDNEAFGGIASLAALIYLILYSILGLYSESFPKKYGYLFIVLLVINFIGVVFYILFAVGAAFLTLIVGVIRFFLAYGFYKQSKQLTS
jgi:hypothetical protein